MSKLKLAEITIAGVGVIAIGVVLKKISERIKKYGEIKIS